MTGRALDGSAGNRARRRGDGGVRVLAVDAHDEPAPVEPIEGWGSLGLINRQSLARHSGIVVASSPSEKPTERDLGRHDDDYRDRRRERRSLQQHLRCMTVRGKPSST